MKNFGFTSCYRHIYLIFWRKKVSRMNFFSKHILNISNPLHQDYTLWHHVTKCWLKCFVIYLYWLICLSITKGHWMYKVSGWWLTDPKFKSFVHIYWHEFWNSCYLSKIASFLPFWHICTYYINILSYLS